MYLSRKYKPVGLTKLHIWACIENVRPYRMILFLCFGNMTRTCSLVVMTVSAYQIPLHTKPYHPL